MHPTAATSYAIQKTHRRPSDARLMGGKCWNDTQVRVSRILGRLILLSPDRGSRDGAIAVVAGGSDKASTYKNEEGRFRVNFTRDRRPSGLSLY